jgi:hypothetical protein
MYADLRAKPFKDGFSEIGLHIRKFSREISMEKASVNTGLYGISVRKPY